MHHLRGQAETACTGRPDKAQRFEDARTDLVVIPAHLLAGSDGGKLSDDQDAAFAYLQGLGPIDPALALAPRADGAAVWTSPTDRIYTTRPGG